MQKIHTITTPPVMSKNNSSTTSDLIASVVAGHKINNKNNSSNKKISSSVVVSNNNNNNEPTTNINENGTALKIAKPIPAKPNGKNGNFTTTITTTKNLWLQMTDRFEEDIIKSVAIKWSVRRTKVNGSLLQQIHWGQKTTVHKGKMKSVECTRTRTLYVLLIDARDHCQIIFLNVFFLLLNARFVFFSVLFFPSVWLLKHWLPQHRHRQQNQS